MNHLKKIITNLIYLYFFLLPISTVWIIQEPFISDYKWQEGTILLYASEIILWLIFTLFLIFLIKNKQSVISQFKQLTFSNLKFININRSRLLVVGIIWMFVALSGLSFFWSGNKFLTLYYLWHLIEVIALSLIILNLDLNFNKLSWSFIMAGLVQSFLAISQFLSQNIIANKYLGIAAHLPVQTTASVIEINGTRWLRAYGTFSHPNLLGGFLVISFLAAFYFYLTNQSPRRKMFGLIASLFIFIGLFFTFSRSAWLAAFIATGSLIGFYGFKKHFIAILKILIYLGLVTSVLIIFYGSMISTRLSFSERLEIRSVDRRVESIIEAEEIIAQNLFLGVGLGNYSSYLIELKPNVPGWSYQPVHNIYILVFTELGLLGLLLFIGLIWRSLISATYNINQNPIYISWLISVLVIGLFDHYFWTSYQGIVLLFIIILTAFSGRKNMTVNWDNVAKEYSRLIGERGDFVRQLIINPYIEKQLNMIGTGKVLDLGCGEGYLSRLFSSDKFEFISVDASANLLAEAKYKKTPGQIIQADICGDINLVKNDFEVVVMNMVLMDVVDIKLAYKNAYSFLKPNGLLVVTILHPVLGSPSGYLFKTWREKILRRDPFIRVDNYGREFSRNKVIASLSQATKIYHRPMATYIQEAIATGFILSNIAEPMMADNDLKSHGQPKFLSKYPIIVALTFAKPVDK